VVSCPPFLALLSRIIAPFIGFYTLLLLPYLEDFLVADSANMFFLNVDAVLKAGNKPIPHCNSPDHGMFLPGFLVIIR
jgi:hypothetical protein